MVSIALSMFPTGLFLTVAFVDMVFSEEYKNQTMKNTLAFGTSRAGFYLGKLLTELITALVSLLVILGVILGAGVLVLGPVYPVPFLELFSELGKRLLVTLPLWIGALSFGNMLAFHVKSSTLYTLGFVGFFGFLPVILSLRRIIIPSLGEVSLWADDPAA